MKKLQINHGNPKIIFVSYMSRPILGLLYAALKSGFALAIRKYFQNSRLVIFPKF